jgi:hypothetical protein
MIEKRPSLRTYPKREPSHVSPTIRHFLERHDEAHAFLRKTLTDGPDPTDELEVRTHRYRKALEKLLPPSDDGG